MRLLTHNLLCCPKCQSYPLDIQSTDLSPAEAPFDAAFVRRMLPRLLYQNLVDAFASLKQQNRQLDNHGPLPPTLEELDLSDESKDLRAVHYAMNAVAVKNGALKCPQCETRCPIVDYVPNMVPE